MCRNANVTSSRDVRQESHALRNLFLGGTRDMESFPSAANHLTNGD